MRRACPLIGLAQAGAGGFFDDGGFPAGQGWDEVDFPGVGDEHVYALEVTGNSMLPLYRDGDTIIVSPDATVRRGDRVVVKTHDGEVMAKMLARRPPRRSSSPRSTRSMPAACSTSSEVAWMARIDLGEPVGKTTCQCPLAAPRRQMTLNTAPAAGGFQRDRAAMEPDKLGRDRKAEPRAARGHRPPEGLEEVGPPARARPARCR